MGNVPPAFIPRAMALLAEYWDKLPDPVDPGKIPVDISEAIERSVNCKVKTYRYVLPTQLLAKVTDAAIDCRCVQMQSNLVKPFDARSLCHSVIVPFDQANHGVLGGSVEPYINNPIRIPAITVDALGPQRDKKAFQDLIDVLAYAQRKPEHAPQMFCMVLAVIRRRLEGVRVAYPAPKRVALLQTMQVVEAYLRERTGGLRLQVVAVALFKTIGRAFALFDNVQSSGINAADASTGNAADLVCVDAESVIVLAVEVKDRELRLYDLQGKLSAIRERGIGEALFLVRGGIADEDREKVEQTIEHQFPSGHNVYVAEFSEFLGACLMLFGEKGRSEFLRLVGQTLDARGVDVIHRRKWAELLGRL